jgi:hypothetical protein
MKTRTINILGFNVDVYKFGKRSFYYPQFNGDAEFEVSSKGFRKLHHYLRNVIWSRNIVLECEKMLYL